MSRQTPPRPHRLLLYSVLAWFLLAPASLLITTSAVGQNKPSPRSVSQFEPPFSGQLSLRGTVGIPQGGLRRNISGLGGGLHVYLGGWVKRNPVLISLDAGFLTYGSTTDEVPFSSTVETRVPVRVETKNNVMETHLSLRLQPRNGQFRPYVEGLLGFKYLFTRTSVETADLNGGPGSNTDGSTVIASSINYDDFALSGGAGAGVAIRTFRQDDPDKNVRTVSLHLGVQYLWGSEAEYLTKGELTDTNANGQLDRSELDVHRSRTTFLQPQFGLTLQF